MSIGGPRGDRPSKNQRREAARTKARALREAQKKKDRRNKFLLQGGIAVAILAIIAVVVIVISSTVRPPALGPKNMASDGITIGKGFKAVRTPALKAGAEPIETTSNSSSSDVFHIRVYEDYMCPICGAFEAANAAQIQKLVDTGVATLEKHPISILDRNSMGTKYSTRAANAAACVANFSPDRYFAFSALLFDHQPKELTEGLTDDQIVALTKQAKVTDQSSITKCIKEQTFKNWVAAATQRALTGPIPGTKDIPAVQGTPTILVNGQNYKYSTAANGAFDPEEFSNFLLKVAGDKYTQQPTPTPSPSGTPTPSPSLTPTP